jgi:pentatricopeptide repeat protein
MMFFIILQFDQRCAGNSGRIDLAKKLFTDLSKSTKLRPNVYSYGALMHGFAKTKSYKQSLLYLDRMVADGVMPNQVRQTNFTNGDCFGSKTMAAP